MPLPGRGPNLDGLIGFTNRISLGHDFWGNSKPKLDFAMPAVFVLITILCLLMDMAPFALLSLALGIYAVHEAVKESREG